MQSHNILKVQFSIFLGRISKLDQNKVGPLGHPINNDHNRIMLSSSTRQAHNKVHVDNFSLPSGNFYALSQASQPSMFGLDLVISWIFSHKLRYVFILTIPLIYLSQVLVHIGGTQMYEISRCRDGTDTDEIDAGLSKLRK